MKNALITGITGQDGAYLAKFLLDKGYEVFGTYRRLSTPNFWRLLYLDIYEKVTLIPAELSDMSSLTEALKISNPSEIYHLAAQSFVDASFDVPITTGDITGISTTRFLEVIRQFTKDAKFYYAATSEMYGKTGIINKEKPLNENDYFYPMSPYAASKLYGYWITKIYRETYNLHCCNGILFNHESPIRGLEFVTRKITNGVAKIVHGISKTLELGNIHSKRDWGYAPEYVEAMWLMLQKKEPDDYVISTGKFNTVKEFVELAFECVGLDMEKYLKINTKYFRPLDLPSIVGDNSKAQEKLGWKPKIKINELVEIMVSNDVERWGKWVKGETFPWDAPNYPSESPIFSNRRR